MIAAANVRCPGCGAKLAGLSCLKCKVDAMKAAGKVPCRATLRLRKCGSLKKPVWQVAACAAGRRDILIANRRNVKDAVAEARLALRDPAAWGCESLKPAGRLVRLLAGGAVADADWRLYLTERTKGGRRGWTVEFRRAGAARRTRVFVTERVSLADALDAALGALESPPSPVAGTVEPVGRLAEMLKASGGARKSIANFSSKGGIR